MILLSIDWSTIASIATAIGVVVMTWQLKEARAIAQSSFEDSFDQQYRELARGIPVDALIGNHVQENHKENTRELIYNYLDLSNEQAYFRLCGRVRKRTWEGWCLGIKANLNKVEFNKVWTEVYNYSPDTFTYLARLKEDEFTTDPKSWKDLKH